MSQVQQGEMLRYLAFSLAGEEYAVPLLKVKEVIALSEITPVPQTPSYFRGIMNLRGQIISVVDLRSKLRLPPAAATGENAIIILDIAEVSLGAVVDSIDSVLAVASADVSPTPDLESNVSSEFITGVTRRGKKLVLLLDIEQTLSVDELVAVNRAIGKKAA
jgi:purine-binding chemotaxis protein CheW